MSEFFPQHLDPGEEARCQDCDWAGPAGETTIVKDAERRLVAGEDVPAGECPACSALAYVRPVNEPGVLTGVERSTLELLAAAWNTYLGNRSDDDSIDELDDFRRSVHEAQRIVLCGPARRANPDILKDLR